MNAGCNDHSLSAFEIGRRIHFLGDAQHVNVIFVECLTENLVFNMRRSGERLDVALQIRISIRDILSGEYGF